MVEKQTEQPALFDIEAATTVAPVTPDIAPAPGSRSVDYEPTATQRYLEEMGGGSRETLAADPPKIRRKKHTSNRPIENRYTDIGSDTAAIVTAGEAFEKEYGSNDPRTPAAANTAMQAAGVVLNLDTTSAKASELTSDRPDRKVATELAITRARAERKQR